MRKTIVAAALAALSVSAACAAPFTAQGFAARLAASAPNAGVSVAAVGADGSVATAVAGEGLSPATTFRVASNTKTFVAATVLRLWEDGKLKLDDSMRGYVDPAYIAALEKDGYDTAKITVRQLLAHTSGLADHAQTKQFLDFIQSRPDHGWTRAGQMQALVDWTDPLSAPGAQFHYSDDGYCLLGNIIERITGQPLAVAVRSTLGFDKLGLSSTYWETQEPAPTTAGPRAHQYLMGQDTYGWNPSLDMYGGGGLVSTPADLARFLAALFEGKVFKRPGTLQVMLSKEGIPADSPYRLGIFEVEVAGVKGYWHSGFWGTAALYVPSQHRGYAFAVTRQDAFKPAFEAVKALVPAATL
ncbi:MAG TPA: serine hydrolase domain-containing protein [Telluria sp.]|nr:serine hydrolase domain-containing protein [Telluria sp.]